jgi:hypothetical protein
MKTAEKVPPLVIRAECSRLAASAIEAIASELPADQGQVAELLEAAVDGYFGRGFTVRLSRHCTRESPWTRATS